MAILLSGVMLEMIQIDAIDVISVLYQESYFASNYIFILSTGRNPGELP